MAVELRHNDYYYDSLYNNLVQYVEYKNGYYWFYCPEDNRHFAYYEYELDNLREY